jgi:hypothetical protein
VCVLWVTKVVNSMVCLVGDYKVVSTIENHVNHLQRLVWGLTTMVRPMQCRWFDFPANGSIFQHNGGALSVEITQN